ncbi:Ankyrin repeat-containing domain protein [Moelleriella libera RCEF 2490]|uniref:Ankyrin repeat-containing domain protein n=1 Tax=Moelleriella libera RCEF 2490 TaxID=1081109 RepID=A0A167WFK8_9HYPO|nr:Ankyrin repeat-containing domain protein [Moelleriella libera RCEF 2490]
MATTSTETPPEVARPGEAEGNEWTDEEWLSSLGVRYLLKRLKANVTVGVTADEQLSDVTKRGRKGLDEFMEFYQKLLVQTTRPEHKNILHLIAEEEDPDFVAGIGKLTPLVTALIHLHPNTLATKDSCGRTPVHAALLSRKQSLVRVMCKAHKDINSILRIRGNMPGQKLANCIHFAIKNQGSKADDRLLLELIRYCKSFTLRALDGDGFSTLHLAVDYKRRGPRQNEIAQRLVKQCGRLCSVECDYKGDLLSAYRYLLLTRQEAKQKQKNPENTADLTRNADFPESESHNVAPSKANEGESAAPITMVNPPSGSGEAPEPVSNGSQRESLGEQGTTATAEEMDVDESRALKLQRYIKLACLERLTHHKARQMLYGIPKDDFTLSTPHTVLSFHRADSLLSPRQFRDTFRDIPLEVGLHHVDIPHLKVDPNSSAAGRVDLVVLFKWLYVCKKVLAVFEVIVNDLEEPSHSDSSIEKAMSYFRCINTWKWAKFDMCPELIRKVAPELHTLHLYWSGSNAVLRGWSEKQGIRRLENLKDVTLHYPKNLECDSRAQSNIKAFKNRVQSGRKIRVDISNREGISPRSHVSSTNFWRDFLQKRWAEGRKALEGLMEEECESPALEPRYDDQQA